MGTSYKSFINGGNQWEEERKKMREEATRRQANEEAERQAYNAKIRRENELKPPSPSVSAPSLNQSSQPLKVGSLFKQANNSFNKINDYNNNSFQAPQTNLNTNINNDPSYNIANKFAQGALNNYKNPQAIKNEPSWGTVVNNATKSALVGSVDGLLNMARVTAHAVDNKLDNKDGAFIKWLDNNHQYLNNKVQGYEENLKDVSPYSNKDFLNQGVKGVVQVGTMFLPGAAVSKGAKAAGLGAKAINAARMVPFGVQAGGNYASDAEKQGATENQQLAYGLVGGVAEIASESMFGIGPLVSKFGKAGAKEIINAGADTLVKKYGKLGLSYAKNILGETAQEVAIDPVMGLAEKGIYNKDKALVGKDGVIDTAQMGQDAFGGAAMSVLLSAIGLGSNTLSHRKASYLIENNIKPTEETIKDIQNTMIEELKTFQAPEVNPGGAIPGKGIQNQNAVNPSLNIQNNNQNDNFKNIDTSKINNTVNAPTVNPNLDGMLNNYQVATKTNSIAQNQPVTSEIEQGNINTPVTNNMAKNEVSDDKTKYDINNLANPFENDIDTFDAEQNNEHVKSGDIKAGETFVSKDGKEYEIGEVSHKDNQVAIFNHADGLQGIVSVNQARKLKGYKEEKVIKPRFSIGDNIKVGNYRVKLKSVNGNTAIVETETGDREIPVKDLNKKGSKIFQSTVTNNTNKTETVSKPSLEPSTMSENNQGNVTAPIENKQPINTPKAETKVDTNLEAPKTIEPGQRYKTNFGEVTVKENDGAMIKLVNKSGTEIPIGVKAFNNIKPEFLGSEAVAKEEAAINNDETIIDDNTPTEDLDNPIEMYKAENKDEIIEDRPSVEAPVTNENKQGNTINPIETKASQNEDVKETKETTKNIDAEIKGDNQFADTSQMIEKPQEIKEEVKEVEEATQEKQAENHISETNKKIDIKYPDIDLLIERRKDTRDNRDMWVVKIKTSLKEAKDTYNSIVSDIKKAGGSRWSKFTKGFNFYENPTDEIAKLGVLEGYEYGNTEKIENDITEAKSPEKTTRLFKVGDKFTFKNGDKIYVEHAWHNVVDNKDYIKYIKTFSTGGETTQKIELENFKNMIEANTSKEETIQSIPTGVEFVKKIKDIVLNDEFMLKVVQNNDKQNALISIEKAIKNAKTDIVLEYGKTRGVGASLNSMMGHLKKGTETLELEKNRIYNQIKEKLNIETSQIDNKEGERDNGENDNRENSGVKENGQIDNTSSNEVSEGDNKREPERFKVQPVQGANEQVLSHGDAVSSIKQDNNTRADTTNTDSISGDKEHEVSGGKITTGDNEIKTERKNLKLNIEDDWLSNTARTQYSSWKIKDARKEMNKKVMDILEKEDKDITEEDKQILKNYTGKGGLGESGREILTQYFTDYQTVDMIYKKIEQLGFDMNDIKALDPSTGAGVFMGMAPDGIKFDAIDIDPISARISKILYPDSKVMNKGFEEHRVNNAYDLVITNVPFSTTRGEGVVKDKPNIKELHNYFMLAALDKAKDNGLIVVITPSSVMDGIGNNNVRNEISKNAEFITSYRLPDNVFEKTGTDAITDIIFLRRKVRNSPDESTEFAKNNLFSNVSLVGKDFLDGLSWNDKVKKDAQIALNSFYKEHQENMLGRRSVTLNRYGQPIIKIKGQLEEKIIDQVLNDDVKYEAANYIANTKNEDNIIYYEPGEEDITPNGGIFKDNGKWYKKEQQKGKDGVILTLQKEISFDKSEEKVAEEFLNVASKSQTLRVAARTNSNVEKLTKELKKSVDDFVKKYGKEFKKKTFIEKISSDPRYSIVKVLLDNPDIFKENTLSVKEYKIPENDVNNLSMISKHLMNKYGEITVKNFAENYQGGISEEKAREILNNSDQFFKLPSEYEKEHFDTFGNVTYTRETNNNESYARSIDYLSGDIYKKIDFAKEEIEKGNKEFKKNLEALKKVLPKSKTLNDTTISLKAKWLDAEAIEKFLLGYLDLRADITYNDIKGKFVAEFKGSIGNDKWRTLTIDGKGFNEWFSKYLNGENLNVYVDGKKDQAASTKATQAMRKIDEYFMNYLKANPEIAGPIMDRYNRIANNWVDKDYKKDVLVIPGANPNFKFRSNQLEFVNMAITLGSAVNAQRTGAGKTATNAAVNQMLKVTGRANKPMAIVPGKVIKKFVRDIKEGSRGLASIFPDMKILDTTDYTFNEAMARIAFNNWDLVLIPDTWFKNIEVTPDRESQYVQKMIDDLVQSEKERAVDKGSKRSQKDFEKRLEQLKAKLAELRNYARKDGIYFEDLGVDAISLDEAQSVKNLVTSAKGSELGMSATPSQTALDFNMKAKYIMEKKDGKNVFLYTATPVSNSILEIYGLLQNIAPHEWINRGIYTADDFIEAVVDTSETIGVTKENEIATVHKVDGFINIDDLRNLFKKYVDYRPFIEGAIIPDVEDTRYIVQMTDWQRNYFNDILERLQEIKSRNPRVYGTKNGEDVLDNVMTVLGDARRASISPTLVTGELPTRKNSPKIALGIEIAAKIYKTTGKNQIIFLDDYGDKALGKNNLHNFIKSELAKEGIPASEIIIVNGNTNANVDKKLKIQDDFNDGKYKVIIGTTESIGAGMDLQENSVSMINLDIPWTPTSVTQRRGRAERPGNQNKLVADINIFTKGSYDAWSSNIVGIKKKWQDQLLEGSNDSTNGYLKNQDDDNFDLDTIMTELMEDPVEKELLNIQGTRNLLTAEINNLKTNGQNLVRQINDVNKGIDERNKKIENYQKELIEKPDSKSAPLMIEKHTKTIKGLEDELVELTSRKENIEDTVKLKEEELENLNKNTADRIKVAEERRKNKPKEKKEKNDINSLSEKLKKTNLNNKAKANIPNQFTGEGEKIGIVAPGFNSGISKEGKHTFKNEKMNQKYEANKGLKKVPKIEKIKNELKNIKDMSTRTYRHIDENDPTNSQFIKEMTQYSKYHGLAADETIRILDDITSELGVNSYDTFSKYVLFKDLQEEAEKGNLLPFELTKEEVNEELEALKPYMADYVIESIEKRNNHWKKLKDNYIQAMKDVGFNVADKFKRENYFRHQVIDKMTENQLVKGASGKFKTPTGRGFLKQRKGSTLDINVDYLQAEYEVMAQMIRDTKVAQMQKRIIDKYDLSKDLKEEAKKMTEENTKDLKETLKELRQELSGIDKEDTKAIERLESKISDLKEEINSKTVDWTKLIPDGYSKIQLREGNTYYTATTLAERFVNDIIDNTPESTEINSSDLKSALAVGKKYPEYVFDNNIVKTLQKVTALKDINPIAKFGKKTLGMWKRWVLGVNPHSFLKYNIRNMTGDLDKVTAADPRIIKHSKRATSELYAAMKYGRFTPNMLEYYNHGGFNNLTIPQEIAEISDFKKFKDFYNKKTGVKVNNPFIKWIEFTEFGNDLREGVLRYSAFLQAKEDLKKGRPIYWASKPSLIDGLSSISDKSYKLANDLLGAYDEVTETGKIVRDYWIPFYSWLEVNFKGYMNLLKNNSNMNIIEKQLQYKGKDINAANKAGQLLLNNASFGVKAALLTAILYAWNNLVVPDDEDELPDEIKSTVHITLGRDKNGNIWYFNRLGSLSDALEWFGLSGIFSDIRDLKLDRKTGMEQFEDMLKRPVNKVVSGINPFIKSSGELLTGKKLYPDIFNPSAIRDKRTYIGQTLGLSYETSKILGIPTETDAKDNALGFVGYKSDPEANAYYSILDKKRQFEEKELGQYPSEAYNSSPKTLALYYYKLALKKKDMKLANKYLGEYYKNGGTEKGIAQSINMMSPLYGLVENEKEDRHELTQFKEFLTSDEKRQLDKAMKYYQDLAGSSLVKDVGSIKNTIIENIKYNKGDSAKRIRKQAEQIYESNLSNEEKNEKLEKLLKESESVPKGTPPKKKTEKPNPYNK